MPKQAMTPADKAKKQAEKERLAKIEADRIAKLTPEQRKAEKDKLKSDNFKRLAMQRTINVLKRLDQLQQTSSKSNYSYSEEQVSNIFDVIKKKLNEVESSFIISKKTEDYGLSL